jgi:hypothetical protein
VQPERGSGEFVELERVRCDKIPGQLKAADFNNDGKMDIVALCREVDGIRVHLNRGNAKFDFDHHTLLKTGGYGPWDLVPADFNNDGLIDIAVVNTFSSNMAIFRNVGDGSFRDPIVAPVRRRADGDRSRRRERRRVHGHRRGREGLSRNPRVHQQGDGGHCVRQAGQICGGAFALLGIGPRHRQRRSAGSRDDQPRIGSRHVSHQPRRWHVRSTEGIPVGTGEGTGGRSDSTSMATARPTS